MELRDVYRKSFPSFECKSERWQIIQWLNPKDACTIINAMFEFWEHWDLSFETKDALEKNYLLNIIWHYFKVFFLEQKLEKFKDLKSKEK